MKKSELHIPKRKRKLSAELKYTIQTFITLLLCVGSFIIAIAIYIGLI